MKGVCLFSISPQKQSNKLTLHLFKLFSFVSHHGRLFNLVRIQPTALHKKTGSLTVPSNPIKTGGSTLTHMLFICCISYFHMFQQAIFYNRSINISSRDSPYTDNITHYVYVSTIIQTPDSTLTAVSLSTIKLTPVSRGGI